MKTDTPSEDSFLYFLNKAANSAPTKPMTLDLVTMAGNKKVRILIKTEVLEEGGSNVA